VERKRRAVENLAAGWKIRVILSIFLLLVSLRLRADPNRCEICGGRFGDTIYTKTDSITHEKKYMCYACASWPDDCYICGLPARQNSLELPDGRFLCARDSKAVVLDDRKALRICNEAREALDRLLARFTTFPGTNVDVEIVDRVNLMELFKVPGNDFACPNVLGYTQFTTNEDNLEITISLMSGLLPAEFKSTVAHEYTHCWVFENVSPKRRKALNRSAEEGFCELISYLLMDAQREEGQKRVILGNAYSRGQIQMFIEAEKRYGLDDVLEWMKHGVDAQLKDPAKVRDLETPRLERPAPATNAAVYVYEPPPAPDTLILRSVSWIRNQPLAVINDRTLGVGESAKVRLGKTNVLVRCLAITNDSARIQLVGSGEEQKLFLKTNAR
jgi:hypothetical protein